MSLPAVRILRGVDALALLQPSRPPPQDVRSQRLAILEYARALNEYARALNLRIEPLSASNSRITSWEISADQPYAAATAASRALWAPTSRRGRAL
jgi:hypothetical protein